MPDHHTSSTNTLSIPILLNNITALSFSQNEDLLTALQEPYLMILFFICYFEHETYFFQQLFF